MKVKVTATIKKHGSYNTDDYHFDSQEDYDDWLDNYEKNNNFEKVIGIHKEEYYK